MAFFDRFRKTPEDGERKIENDYEVAIDKSERLPKTKKARKRGRNILIGLGIAAIVATIAMPFAIGLAATATGAAAATLTGLGVAGAVAAIGVDIAFISAYVGSRAQRRKAKSAKRLEKGSKRTLNKMDRSETKNMISKICEIVDSAEIAKKEANLDAVHTKKGVKFVGVDKDLVAVWSAEPLTDDEKAALMDPSLGGVDFIGKFAKKDVLTDAEKAELAKVVALPAYADKGFDFVKRFELNRKLTDAERITLMKGMRPDDAAAKKIFGNATVSYKYPYEYEKIEITPKGKDPISVELCGVSAKTLQGHKLFEQQLANLANGASAEASLDFYTGDPTIKHRYQRAILNDRKDATGATISAENNAKKVLATTVAAEEAHVFG